MSGASPPGWRQGTLADAIASISTGVSVNGEDRPVREGEVGVLKITAVLRGVFEPQHQKAVVPADRHRVACPVRGGTVLVSRANGNADLVGAAAYVEDDHPGLFLPDKLWALEPASTVNPLWLFAIVTSPIFRRQVKQAATGTSSLKNISQEAFLRLPVLIPPRPEQDSIASKLSEWNEAIRIGQRLTELHRSALRAARHRLLEQAEADPVEFGKFAVNTNRLVTSQGANERGLGSVELELLEEATGRILGRADPSTLKGARRAFEPGDVLFGRLRPYLRKFAHPDEAGVCSTEIWVLSAHHELCLPGYLYQVVQSEKFISEANKSSGSRMPRADWEVLSEVPFPLPPLDQQVKIISLLAAEECAINLLADMVEQFRRQRAALTSLLLSGAVRLFPRGSTPQPLVETVHA